MIDYNFIVYVKKHMLPRPRKKEEVDNYFIENAIESLSELPLITVTVGWGQYGFDF